MDGRSLQISLNTFALRRRSDERVLSSALEGDPVAFAEIYQRYHLRVRGYCLARTMDAHVADDVTQEVFLRLLRSGPAEVTNAKAWLFTVARNAVLDAARRDRRDLEDTFAPDEYPAHVAPTRDSADEVLDRDVARNVFAALRRLPPRQRTALILRELHGQSSVDIAEAMQTSAGNVDVLVSRARDSFGAAYADVSALPAACRTAVMAIYRRRGSGLTMDEQTSLTAHLKGCTRCREEQRRANSKRYMPSLLPFLIPANADTPSLLARAAEWLRVLPHPLLPSAMSAIESAAPGAKTALVVLFAAAAFLPTSEVSLPGSTARPVTERGLSSRPSPSPAISTEDARSPDTAHDARDELRRFSLLGGCNRPVDTHAAAETMAPDGMGSALGGTHGGLRDGTVGTTDDSLQHAATAGQYEESGDGARRPSEDSPDGGSDTGGTSSAPDAGPDAHEGLQSGDDDAASPGPGPGAIASEGHGSGPDDDGPMQR